MNSISTSIGTPIRETTSQTANVVATGVKGGINTTANTANQAIDLVTQPLQANTSQSYETLNSQQTTNGLNQNQNQNQEEDSLNNALNNAISTGGSGSDSIQPSDSYSSINNPTSGKSGWCFIGEEEGNRSCIKVGLNDTCMSGDIFPTNEVCINPNLRV